MDPTYHDRHLRKAKNKAKLVSKDIGQKTNVLDIGCNRGIISKTLLERHENINIEGYDLQAGILLESLASNNRFTFHEESIVYAEIEPGFDITLYFAVHHHIVHQHGLTKALETLRKIASNTEHFLYFETGKIIEGPYWTWQPSLKNYFSYDEEHYHCIIECLEDLINGWEIIGFNRIHGVRREIIRFELTSPSNRQNNINREGLTVIKGLDKPTEPRSPLSYREITSSPLSEVFRLSQGNQNDIVLKRCHERPVAQYREYLLSRAIDSDWAVSALGYTEDLTFLVFPYIHESKTFSDFDFSHSNQTSNLLSQLRKIRLILKTTSAAFPRALNPGETEIRRIYDVCDFNPRNFLVKVTSNGIATLLVVDFGYQSSNYRWKNDLHFATLEKNLKCNTFHPYFLQLAGYLRVSSKLIIAQFRSRKSRILARFPSLGSVIFNLITDIIGKLLLRIRNS